MDKRIRVFYALGIVLLMALSFTLFWIFGHSFLTIESGATDAGIKTYRIINIDGYESKITTAKNSVRQVLKKGSYQVTVEAGTKNYFSFVETKGLLKTTYVRGTLSPEHGRTFVGNNPAPCMYYFDELLYSTECGESIRSLAKHIPASGYVPSYISYPENTALYGINESLVTLETGNTYALLKDVEGIAGYSIQQIFGDMQGGERVRLEGPNPDYSYKMKPYKNGLIVYSNEYPRVYFVDPTRAMNISPIEITTPPAVPLRSITVQGRALVLLYSVAANLDTIGPEDDRAEQDSLEDAQGETEVIVYEDGAQKNYKFPFTYSSGTQCAKDRLCLVGLGGASVYDTSEKKQPRLLYRVPLVIEAVGTNTDSVRFITPNGLILFNPTTASGYLEYAFGQYRPCGYNDAVSGGFLLCLIDTKQNKVGLLIKNSPLDGGAIDKQIQGLLASRDVSAVSVYKNSIIVIPSYPERNSQAENKRIAQTIDTLVRESGIDEKTYTIINVGDIQ